MTERWTSPCGRMELRLGDYREVLADVEAAEVMLTDPPYSDRTHSGQRTGTEIAKATITYPGWTDVDAAALAEWASCRVRFWALTFSDHSLQRSHERAWDVAGWYTFAPVGWLRTNATPRVAGDGPTSAFDYITVARPRRRIPPVRRGSRPGCYRVVVSGRTIEHVGGKPLDGIQAIVRDYSRPGDLIVDPCAGGGTTLLAAAIEGRRAIGAEIDPETYRKAVERLSRGYTPVVQFDALTGTQEGLL